MQHHDSRVIHHRTDNGIFSQLAARAYLGLAARGHNFTHKQSAARKGCGGWHPGLPTKKLSPVPSGTAPTGPARASQGLAVRGPNFDAFDNFWSVCRGPGPSKWTFPMNSTDA
eukprot:gene16122-biopygen9770